MTKPAGATKLYVIPCQKEKASEFIENMHRHHLPLDFGTYSLAVCSPDGTVHGVAIIGRTTTQHFHVDDIPNQWVQEVRRVATDGTPNACSALYGAAWRFVKALGYRMLISYTLPEEGGSSLRALGWKRVDNVGGNPWAHRSKRGYDIHPVGKKTRWEIRVEHDSLPPFDDITWPMFDTPQKYLPFDSEVGTVEGDGVGVKIKKQEFLQNTLFAET